MNFWWAIYFGFLLFGCGALMGYLRGYMVAVREADDAFRKYEETAAQIDRAAK